MADLARKAERSKHLATLAAELEPYLVNRLARISTGTGTASSGGLVAHALDGAYHTGTLATSQAPWAVTTTSFNSHTANADAHHARQHSITSTSDHTITGAALSVVGATALNTLGLLTPSSAPGAAEALLKSSSAGNLTLPTLTASTKLTAPAIDTASGNLTITPAGGTVAVVGTETIVSSTEGSGSGNQTYQLGISKSGAGSLQLGTHSGYPAISGQGTGSSFRLLLNPENGGSVGIGTTSPSYTLDTNGTGRFASTLNLADGAVGTPSLTFTSDTNTGIYRSGTDAFSLVANGAGIINVGATGTGVNTAFDSTAALKVLASATDDITLFLKQKASQTGRMLRVEDSAGQELIVLDSQGNLQSGNPGFVSGLTGWQITPTGTAEFNNVWVRGELHASIFVMDEFHASGGTLVVAPAGKLENDATINVTTGIEAVFDIRTTSVSGSGSQLDIRTTSVSGSGSQITLRTIENYFEITDPPSGHATIFAVGDTLRCKSLGNPGVGIDLYDIWATVTRIEDMTDYYRYYYTRQSGGSNGITIPAGAAVIDYRQSGDGAILLTADQNYAPYIDIFTVGAQPWNGDITPHTRLGRLDGVGLPGVSGIEQYGMVTSTNLASATAPYIVNSNLQMFSYNVDSEWNNGNPTARITSGGEFRLGTDVDADSTTGLKFNPTTGALTIGNASYPGTVTVYGSITVTSGSGIAAFSDANLDNIANGATYFRTTANQVTGAGRAYTALSSSNNLVTSVIPATAIGNPGTPGLFLGSDYMGYHSGNGLSTGWKTYMDSSGNFRFQGSSTTNYLQWAASSNKLQGVGSGTEQWYADATDGKLKFGGGNGFIDADGLTLVTDSVTSHASQSSTRAVQFERSNGTLVGRLTSYYISAGDDYGLDLYARSPNTEDTYATFGAEQAGTVYGGGAAGAPRVVAYSASTGSDYLRLYANTEIALYRSGSASADLLLNSSGLTSNVDIDLNSNDITDVGTLGVGTSSPNALQVNSEVTETARGVDNIRMGVTGGTPRIMMEDATYTQWGIDNNAGTFRIFNPGTVKLSLSTSGGMTVNPSAGTSGLSVTTPTNQTAAGIVMSDANCGSSYGPFLAIGRNNNGSTPSAAWLRMYRRDGSTGDLWVDASGNLRIGVASAVTNATDTGGTVVGTQTSSLDSKHIIEQFVDYDSALNAIVDAPLYDFTYKSGAFNGQRFTGVITDYAPTFGMDRDDAHPSGKSLNTISAHGYTFAAIKALHKRIEELERIIGGN